MKWRFIPFKYYNPFLKIALNEVAMQSKEPIVWLAGWKPGCVNIGYGQHIKEVVNLPEAKKRRLLVVRRQGGGGAMLLSKDGEISWSVVAPEKFFPKNPNKIYERVCARIVSALKDLGINARHKPINDVICDEGKLSGATIKKDAGVVYVGGTLLYSVNEKLMRAVLRPERDHIKREKKPEMFKQVTSVSLLCEASFNETIAALKHNLLKGVDFAEGKWSSEELLRAKLLAKKYQGKEWLYQK
jgi:lipoate-protein ligase A